MDLKDFHCRREILKKFCRVPSADEYFVGWHLLSRTIASDFSTSIETQSFLSAIALLVVAETFIIR
jgi:hypothetical protein